MNDPEDFLDACALTYGPGESIERREAARGLLGRVPALAVGNLYVAAAIGDVEACRAALPAADVNCPGGPRGWPPLLYLAYSRVVVGDALAAARLLLDAGADPDAHFWWGDQYRFTALTGAFGEGEQGVIAQPPHPDSLGLARLLLERGANPNDGQGLYNRMFSGAVEPLQLLLEFGLPTDAKANWNTGPGEAQSDFEILPFVMGWDIEHGNLERLECLLEAGVNPDSVQQHGKSAWRMAAIRGQREVRLRLERHGCTPEALQPVERLAQLVLEGDREGATALAGDSPALLVQAQLQSGLLHRAISGRRAGALELLLELGCDPDSRDARGVPALNEAAGAGALEAMRTLLRAGARPDLKDRAYGGTAWSWAHHMGRDDSLEVLREFHPEPEA